MPMVAVFTLIDTKLRGAVVIGGDLSSELGFFSGGVDDFVGVAYPTALGLVDLRWV